ncbi:MAG: hypothetical protein JWM50_1998 [Microbacteriaceae bacterium]|jgi:hypothetical protein|nr:hypothetical protein [Microbacteriaceae bacterium]
MNSFVRKGLYCALFVGGLSLLGIGAANAAETSGDGGLASGTQAVAVLNAPVTVEGNAISVIGDSSTNSTPPTATTPDPATAPAAEEPPSATTSGSGAAASGTQVLVSPVVPATVSDNAVSIVGDSNSSGAPSETSAPAARPKPATTAETSGADGVLGGTQAVVSATVPVTVTGNSVSVRGDSSSTGPSSGSPSPVGRSGEPATTGGGGSVLGATQGVLNPPVPVTVEGNFARVVGESTSGAPVTAGSGSSVDAAEPTPSTSEGAMASRQRPAVNIPGAASDHEPLIPARSSTVSWAGAGAGVSAGVSAGVDVIAAASTIAAARASALAATGPETAPLLALIVLFPLAGLFLLLAALRRYGCTIQFREEAEVRPTYLY